MYISKVKSFSTKKCFGSTKPSRPALTVSNLNRFYPCHNSQPNDFASSILGHLHLSMDVFQILWKLEPTSEEMKIDIIREMPQVSFVTFLHTSWHASKFSSYLFFYFFNSYKVWHLRTGPGTIEQPIEIQCESAIRMVRVHREEVEEEEPTRQEKSTIFVLSDVSSALMSENKWLNLQHVMGLMSPC